MKKIKHFFLPDVQCKPGIDLTYLKYIGQYIVEKKPDVIVCIGDFADLPSLSSYDKGKKSFEGRRYKSDLEAAQEGMDNLLGPMRAFNSNAVKNKHKQYKPRMVLTLGNHEERINRAIENSPELDGIMSYDDLPYQDWEVIDYLKPIEIDGILYSHFNPNPMTGKPRGGKASQQLEKVGKSFVVGHAQLLDMAVRFLPDGTQQWGIICGACYEHDESYKGHVGNHHFRGAMMFHNVNNGSFDPCVISLDYFKDKYGK
jgi:hypothetical protein